MEFIQVENRGNKAVFAVRENTQDSEIVKEIWNTDYYFEYLGEPGYVPSEPGVVIDVGAHIGDFTVQAALMGHTVLAFEPVQENYKMLVMNVEKNGFSNESYRIKLFNAAVTADGRKVSLDWGDKSETGNYKLNSTGQPADSISIKSILKSRPRISILKMDCEGSEMEILRALTVFDFRKIDCIAMEFHGINYENTVKNMRFLEKLLSEYYSTIRINYAEGTNQGRMQAFGRLRWREIIAKKITHTLTP